MWVNFSDQTRTGAFHIVWSHTINCSNTRNCFRLISENVSLIFGGGKIMSTTPGIPRRSPIQVLTWPDVAYLQWSDENWFFPHCMVADNKLLLYSQLFPDDKWKCKFNIWRSKINVCNTRYSQAVTHPNSNLARCVLTSVIRRELVLSTLYGRRQ